MNSEQNRVLQHTIDRCLSAGATQAEAMMARSSSLSVRAFDQKIEQYSVSSSQVLGVRLRKEEKIGVAYCESIDDASVAAMIEDACNNARWMDADEHELIGQGQAPSVLHNSKNYQSDNTTIEEKIELPLKLERDLKKLGPEVKSSPYNGLSESESEGFMLTSSGISTHSKSRSLSCYIQALLSNGQDNMTHYKSSNARTFQTLDPESCLQEAYSFAKDMLNAQKIASGNYSVIFSPNELPEFMESFSIALSGRAAKEGQNPWKDSIGKQVAATQLTLRDIPHYPQAFHYSLYDSEGNIHRDITLIEQGILKTFYHNSATARFFKIPNNASASRSIKGRLGVSGTTQVISAGRDSESTLKSGTYIEVHAMQGLHSGSDAISGDFSFGAKGYLWHNGSCTPFKDVTIAGNYYKLLQQIEGIGDKTYHDDGRSFFSPIIRWHGMLTSR